MKLEPNYYNHFQDDSSQNNVSLEKPSTTNSTSLSPLTISDETIKALIYWLAADLVSQWRTQPAERWDIATVFQSLDPQLKLNSSDFTLANSLLLNSLARSHTSYASFLADIAQSYQNNFQDRFNDISNKGVIKRLIPATAALTKFLIESTQKCEQQLEANFELVATKAHQNIEILFCILKDSGTDVAIDYLVSLVQEIENLIKDYEARSLEYEYLMQSSKQSFRNLSSQLSPLWQHDKKGKADSALNALFLDYKLQIESQLYNVARQVLRVIKEKIEQYVNSLSTVDRWLSELQGYFSLQYPLEPVNPSLLRDLSERIDPITFKSQIESWAELPLYEWSTLDETRTMHLKEQILIRVQHVCWSYYTEALLIKSKLSNSNFLKSVDS